jgi:uncharacterized coiled-coil DUF342 family protein
MTMSETRDAYVAKMKAKLDEWNAEIAKLEAKAKQKEADARKDFEEQIEELKAKRSKANEQLEQMSSAGESAWNDLKAGVEQAADVLGDALNAARSRFS